MEFYNERMGLISPKNTSISLDQLKQYWIGIYGYFKSNNYFDLAESGMVQGKSRLPVGMAPTPDQYLFRHTGKQGIYPISIHSLMDCSKNDIFTIIEIYYNHIDHCKWGENAHSEFEWIHEKENGRKNYSTYINNILRFYESGYYLEPSQGFIMSMPNEALKQQLQTKEASIPDDVYLKLSEASKNYYRFDANSEGKKQAIVSLYSILEPLRIPLADLFNKTYSISKETNDKLIFEIVNKYSIRHNNKKQKDEYSTDIWYDWMMQYYTSVIIAYYRLIAKEK